MELLIAKRPILYQGRMIQPGELLPYDEERMTQAWLRAGSACRVGEVSASEENQETGEEPVNGVVIPDTLDLVDGHFSVDSLMALTRDAMKTLACHLGVKTDGCRNKKELAQLLAALELENAAETDPQQEVPYPDMEFPET